MPLSNRMLFFALSLFIAISPVYAQQTPDKVEGTNYAHRPNTVLKTEDDTLVVYEKGAGKIPVVLIPGHMQDEDFYEGFLERNKEAARYYVAIPPGMGGTPAYPWPDEAEEFISRPWSSRFEEELVNYMDEHLEKKPLLVANWYSGMSMALHIAAKYPERLSGLMIVGPSSRTPYYSWYQGRDIEYNKDLVFDAGAQREVLSGFINFWRTVNEFTWHSNMFSPRFYSVNHEALGLNVVYEEAKGSMPIGLRYFVEYMMDDLSKVIPNITIPIHVVSTVPSKETLTNRLRGRVDEDRIEQSVENMLRFHRNAPDRSWETEENSHIHINFIEDSGLMAWEDEPEVFDRIFLEILHNS